MLWRQILSTVDFCEALMPPPSGKRGWICPKLQSLRLESLSRLQGDAVVQLLHSRSDSDGASPRRTEQLIRSRFRASTLVS